MADNNRSMAGAACLSVALMVSGLTLAANPADGVTLNAGYNKATSTVSLTWTGSQPDFDVFRSASAATITSPANSLAVTGARLFTEPAPAGNLVFYTVTSAPGVVVTGAADHLLLSGTIVGPAGFFEGQILIEGNLLTCVAPSCAAAPGAVGATVIATNGIIMPGMIDASNHALFNSFDETDWTPSHFYTNHNQWTAEPRYAQMVDAKQYLNAESGSPVDVGCQMDKYAEVKALVAGTTSLVAEPGGTSRACYASVIRTVDAPQNDLGADKIQTSTLIPTAAGATSVCNNFASGSTDAYVITVADGTDATALNEFNTLSLLASGCLLSPKTTIASGAALGPAEFATMAAHGMKLVWSPHSNMIEYNDTTRIDQALAAGVPAIALAAEWSLTGSVNQLDELRFADQIDATKFGDILTPEHLFRMVTLDAARVLALDGVLGSLEVGKRADVTVIVGDRSDPYRTLLGAHPNTVRLVFVDGRALYGDAGLVAVGAPGNTCEAASICSADKFLCVAESSSSSQLDETYATFRQALVDALSSYDTLMAGGIAPFSPLAPITKCP